MPFNKGHKHGLPLHELLAALLAYNDLTSEKIDVEAAATTLGCCTKTVYNHAKKPRLALSITQDKMDNVRAAIDEYNEQVNRQTDPKILAAACGLPGVEGFSQDDYAPAQQMSQATPTSFIDPALMAMSGESVPEKSPSSAADDKSSTKRKRTKKDSSNKKVKVNKRQPLLLGPPNSLNEDELNDDHFGAQGPTTSAKGKHSNTVAPAQARNNTTRMPTFSGNMTATPMQMNNPFPTNNHHFVSVNQGKRTHFSTGAQAPSTLQRPVFVLGNGNMDEFSPQAQSHSAHYQQSSYGNVFQPPKNIVSQPAKASSNSGKTGRGGTKKADPATENASGAYLSGEQLALSASQGPKTVYQASMDILQTMMEGRQPSASGFSTSTSGFPPSMTSSQRSMNASRVLMNAFHAPMTAPDAPMTAPHAPMNASHASMNASYASMNASLPSTNAARPSMNASYPSMPLSQHPENAPQTHENVLRPTARDGPIFSTSNMMNQVPRTATPSYAVHQSSSRLPSAPVQTRLGTGNSPITYSGASFGSGHLLPSYNNFNAASLGFGHDSFLQMSQIGAPSQLQTKTASFSPSKSDKSFSSGGSHGAVANTMYGISPNSAGNRLGSQTGQVVTAHPAHTNTISPSPRTIQSSYDFVSQQAPMNLTNQQASFDHLSNHNLQHGATTENDFVDMNNFRSSAQSSSTLPTMTADPDLSRVDRWYASGRSEDNLDDSSYSFGSASMALNDIAADVLNFDVMGQEFGGDDSESLFGDNSYPSTFEGEDMNAD